MISNAHICLFQDKDDNTSESDDDDEELEAASSSSSSETDSDGKGSKFYFKFLHQPVLLFKILNKRKRLIELSYMKHVYIFDVLIWEI